MKIRVINASAGSGKTYRLTQILEEAIRDGRARPEHILATTFTNQAAAELVERARRRLLAGGRALEAHRLMAARIGTVNSVAGSIVADFAFELGLSPTLRVLDERAAELELNRALARVVSVERADELGGYRHRFDQELDWRYEVRRIVEAARANGLDRDDLASSAARSSRELDECLGPCATDDIDATLAVAIERALAAIDLTVDTTGGTADYVELLGDLGRVHRRRKLRWGDWAKLAKEVPRKKSLAHAAPVQAAAARHIEHPRLRAEMHRLIELLFAVAGDVLTAYQMVKRDRGVIDFIDQEVLALRLLGRPDVRAELRGQLDLVLVDEFQDTSPIQLALFLELAELAGESVWVGDPKQAIFGFRGTDPALMDAAIESLTSLRTDPELIDAATRAVAAEVETLSISYRSRPELVDLTSDLFVRAFAPKPEEQIRLTARLARDPADLGSIVEHWPIELPKGMKNAGARAAALAAGVVRLLGDRPPVRDRHRAEVRPLKPGDVAVLCRTNAQCQAVSEALGAQGVAAIVPRVGLLDTAEGCLVHAGLRLWIDPQDALAAAEIARLVSHADDLDGLLAKAFAAPGDSAFRAEPSIAALLAARARRPDLAPIEVLDRVIDALSARALCAAWGEADQRIANLDAFRAQAAIYAGEAEAAGDPVTATGLLRHFEALIDEFGWDKSRDDRQALLAAADAVTISTWHRAKGLEWPVTVLFGLEGLREPVAYGLHVLTDWERFDVREPLAGRWLRFWPNPYTTSNQGGAVKDAFATSPSYDALARRARREALRVLYVGWTRARDRLVLAADREKLLGGLLSTLTEIDPALISEPGSKAEGPTRVTWAGRRLTIDVRPIGPAPAIEVAPVAGEIIVGRPPTVFPSARRSPSTAVEVPCTLGAPMTLGPRLTLRGRPEMGSVGHAVHGFLAADRPGLSTDARRVLATGLLERFGVADSLDPDELLCAASRFWDWVGATFPGGRLHREWPVAHRNADGTLVAGTADLVVRTTAGFAVIDHKTFPGIETAAADHARSFSGQLAAYAAAIEAARGQTVTSTWIHFPVVGQLMNIEIAREGGR